MNYRDTIRKAIECPQFGYDHYGEWGALRLDQRKIIKCLLDELDSADAYFLKLNEENQQLKEQLERSEKARKEAIKFVKTNQRKDEFVELNEWQARDLISILEVEG